MCLLSDMYCALEVDEYGRFYRKARTSFGTTSNETDIKWDEVCTYVASITYFIHFYKIE